MSNKSSTFYPDNTPSKFTIQFPRRINLEGEWAVGLCKINFPNGFVHINNGEGTVCIDVDNSSRITTFIPHGVYPQTDAVIAVLNDDKILKQHFEFDYNIQTRFVTIKKICKQSSCPSHTIQLTEKLSIILGYPYVKNGLSFTKNIPSRTGQRPASIIKALPSLLYIYCDICAPNIIGDSSKQVLRIVSYHTDE